MMRFALCAALSVILVVGCGGSSSVSPGSQAPSVSPTQAASAASSGAPSADANPCPTGGSSDKINLVLWSAHNVDIDTILKDRGAAFTAVCPNVTVSVEPAVSNTDFLQRLLTAAASGTGPDVFYNGTQWSTLLASKGVIAPLDQSQFADVFANMPPAAEQSYTESGVLIGVPFVFGYFGWDYRVDYMKAAGIEHFPTTWTELIDWCQKTVVKDSSGNITREGWDWEFSLAPAYFWNTFDGLLRTTGTTIDAGGKISVDTPQALAVTQLVWDTIWKHQCALPMSKRPALAAGIFPIQKGEASAEFLWPGSASVHIPYGKANPDFVSAWDKAPLFPAQDGGTIATLAVGDAWSVWGKSKHPEAAASFVHWLATKETHALMAQTGTTMARNDVMLSPEVTKFYADNAPGASLMLTFWTDPAVNKLGQPAFRHPEVPAITKIVTDHIIAAFEDPNADLAAVLKAAQAEIDELLGQ
jgi:ABC-type glycerol-3-phosphate transport system substrate-binding protein